jgi:hypothetical protein
MEMGDGFMDIDQVQVQYECGGDLNANMSGGSIDLTSCVSSWPRNCFPLTGSVLLVFRLRQFDWGV